MQASHDWLGKWREIFYPIIKRSNVKIKQSRNYFRHSIENRSVRVNVEPCVCVPLPVCFQLNLSFFVVGIDVETLPTSPRSVSSHENEGFRSSAGADLDKA